jgi:hypothetical protein
MRRHIAIDPAALTCNYEFLLAGAVCRVATNSTILGTVLPAELAPHLQEAAGEFTMQVLVSGENSMCSSPPHFRGLHHLVLATFGPQNIFVFDLARRHVTAIVSEQLAVNEAFWRTTLLPIALGVLGAAVGVVPIHCACLTFGGAGILIGGTSGAGKSTLSVALARDGFDYIADDWTYLSLCSGALIAQGLSIPAKLLPDAVSYFPELAAYPVRMALNQELAYEFSVDSIGGHVQRTCNPRFFFLMDRSAAHGCQFLPMPATEARSYIDRSIELLPLQLQDQIATRSAIIQRVLDLSCWRLSYNGPPSTAVSALRDFLSLRLEDISA